MAEHRKDQGENEMGFSGKIKVLSVAINRYKNSAIPDLSGCGRDALRIRSMLTKQFSVAPTDYCLLRDEAATRAGFIGAFRDHFSDLGPGDIAVLHFSGHGSWENASPEFVEAGLEPAGGRNEVLVCQDSGDAGVWNIADKELRLLIAEVQERAGGEATQRPYFVCLLDCCHSGSMLRQAAPGQAIRFYPGRKAHRPLEAYLEGQFLAFDSLHLPAADYLTLSACSPRESALENEHGGIFTTELLALLSHYEPPLLPPTYADIYSVVRGRVRQRTTVRQTPHLEYNGSVSPYFFFLARDRQPLPPYPRLIREDGQWKAEAGLLHGIRFATLRNRNLPIFRADDPREPIGSCRVRQVDWESTYLDRIELSAAVAEQPPGPETNNGTTDLPPGGPPLLVGLAPPGFPVALLTAADYSLARDLRTALRRNPFFLINNQAACILEIDRRLTAAVYVHRPKGRVRVAGIRGDAPGATAYLYHILNKVRKWTQLMELANPKPSVIAPDKLLVHFEYTDSTGRVISWRSTSAATDSRLVAVPFSPEQGAVPYVIRISNRNPRPLYFYLVHLDRTYGIRQKHEAYYKAVFPGESLCLYDSRSEGVGLGIATPELEEVEDTFVILAATGALTSPQCFEQAGFGSEFGRIATAAPPPPGTAELAKRDHLPLAGTSDFDWVVRKITIRTHR